MSWLRLWAMTRKEAIQLRRDPRSMILAFVLPLVLVLIFGYAITLDIDDIPLAVMDEAPSQQSRSLIAAFEASGYFTVREYLTNLAAADRLLEAGEVRGVLALDGDFARDLGAHRRAPVQLLLDGSDANTASIALNYAQAIALSVSADILLEGSTRRLPITTDSRVWYNERLESQSTIVPGLIAVIMAIIAAMLTSLTIAREWERGTMEQLAATPVHRVEVIVGKMLPYLGIGLLDVAITCIAAVLIFQVPFRGNVALLFAMAALFLVGALGFGIAISAALKSQLLASQAALMATYLPALLLSGFVFAIANMPPVLQAISYAIPARYFVVVTRGVFLKGVGIDVLWGQAVGLLVYSAVGMVVAVRAFRKELAG